MLRRWLAPFLMLFALACSTPDADATKKTDAAAPAKVEPEPAKSETSAAPGTTGEPPTETDTDEEEEEGPAEPLPDHFAELGVAICDQYVTDFERCISEKVPEADREAHRRTLGDNHASWTQTAKGGDSAEAGLKIGCKGAREQAKAATAAFGCEW